MDPLKLTSRLRHAWLWAQPNVLWLSNFFSFGLILFLTFNFAFAPWSWNPIENLLYVRSNGYILPANHISSALAVSLTALVFALKDPSRAYKWMFLVFSTASIHEYILDAWNFPAMWAEHTLGYTITFRWMFWLAFFLVPALLLADRRQRVTMAYIAVFCAVYIGLWVTLAETFSIDTYTILYYAPGPAYHDFIPNFFEVSAWLIPTSFWWLRR